MSRRAAIAYWTAIGAHLTLFFWLFARIVWLAPPAALPRSLVLLVMLGPMLWPLRGMLRARVYTVAWSSFLALWYFTLGVFAATDAADRWFGLAQAALATAWFVGALLFVRWQAARKLTHPAPP